MRQERKQKANPENRNRHRENNPMPGRDGPEGVKLGNLSKGRGRRVGRVTVGLLLALVATAALALLLTPRPQASVMAVIDDCNDAPPQPGPARPWEAEIPVSTYGAVNTRTRNMFTDIPIVSWSGRGPGMNMALYHNAANVSLPPGRSDNVGFDLGPGWSIAYSDQLIFNDPVNPSVITVVEADGTENAFIWDAVTQEWTPPPGVHDKLSFGTVAEQATWTVTHPDQSRDLFQQFNAFFGGGIWRLKSALDATGAGANITYEIVGPSDVVRIHSIKAAGRELLFEYDDTGDFVGEGYEGNLWKIRDPGPGPGGMSDRVWKISYDPDGKMEILTFPEIDGPNTATYRIRLTYDSAGRIKTITDLHDGNIAPYQFTYFADGGVATVTDPDASTDLDDGLVQTFNTLCGDAVLWTHYVDRRGQDWTYAYNEPATMSWPNGNLNRISRPGLSTSSHFSYDADRNLTEARDEMNHGWDAEYDDRGNMLWRYDYVFSQPFEWEYDATNNVTQYTDPAGNVTQFLYDDPNFPTLATKIIEPADGQGQGPAETLMSYSANGQLSEVIDPNGVVTRFTYDAFGHTARYSEGEVFDAQGTPYDVFYETFTYDDGSRLISSRTALQCSSGSGNASYNSAGGRTKSSCEPAELQNSAPSFAPGPGSGIALPSGPALPGISAEFEDATYTPMGQPLDVPVIFTGGAAYNGQQTFAYDNLNRVTQATKGGNTFAYAYDTAGGKVTRTGPDGVETEVTLDAVGRVNHLRRGPAGASLLEARYEYFDNDLPSRVTHYQADGVTVNGSVEYQYYDNSLVWWIDHVNSYGFLVARYEYVYDNIGAPATITEYDGFGSPEYVTSFAYDNRGRLISESRTLVPFETVYAYSYEYDAGGNRTKKIDNANNKEWRYTYDLDDPAAYGSANNRLQLVREYVGTGIGASLSKTTWYVYNCAGNVTRIVSRSEVGGGGVGGGTQNATSSTSATSDATSSASAFEPMGGETDSPTELDPLLVQPTSDGGTTLALGGGGTTQALGGGGGCGFGSTAQQYTGTRFEYARNGQSVTHVLGETWCWDEGSPSSAPTNYAVTWARQFLSDGARQRVLDIELDPAALMGGNLVQLARTTTTYDGDQAYFSTGTTPTGYEPGLGRIQTANGASLTRYDHTDMLGTTRYMTDSDGQIMQQAAYTAFGERVSGTTNRFGYVGAHGYQSTVDTGGQEVMPYLHVGYRYYDPTSGRFLQRDPIGIDGGLNVYEYVDSAPTIWVDPLGLFSLERGAVGAAAGALVGARIPGLGAIPGVIGGAAICFLASGYDEGDAHRLFDYIRNNYWRAGRGWSGIPPL